MPISLWSWNTSARVTSATFFLPRRGRTCFLQIRSSFSTLNGFFRGRACSRM